MNTKTETKSRFLFYPPNIWIIIVFDFSWDIFLFYVFVDLKVRRAVFQNPEERFGPGKVITKMKHIFKTRENEAITKFRDMKRFPLKKSAEIRLRRYETFEKRRSTSSSGTQPN